MKSFTKKAAYIILFILAVFAPGFTSCSKTDQAEGVINRAKIQVVHASPNAGALDFYLDNTKQNDKPLTYFTNTGYFEVNSANDLSVNYRLPGSTTTIAAQLINLRSKISYTLYLTGLASNANYSNLKTFASADTTSAPATGRAKIRVANAAADGLALDFFNGQSDFVRSSANATVSGFVEYTAGKYTFNVHRTGSTSVLTSLDVNLEEGKVYTLLARGLVTQTGASGLALELIGNN